MHETCGQLALCRADGIEGARVCWLCQELGRTGIWEGESEAKGGAALPTQAQSNPRYNRYKGMGANGEDKAFQPQGERKYVCWNMCGGNRMHVCPLMNMSMSTAKGSCLWNECLNAL